LVDSQTDIGIELGSQGVRGAAQGQPSQFTRSHSPTFHAGCNCHRRGFILGVAAAALSLRPRPVLAAGGKYQAMMLGCIDPRMH